MGWKILLLSAVLVYSISILRKNKILLVNGIFSMMILFIIDSNFIKLGAFSYNYADFYIAKIPILYLIGGFFGGNILVYYFPNRKILQFPYIVFSSLLFLLMEYIMAYYGYIKYHNWNLVNSFILDIFGFVIIIWFYGWSTNMEEIFMEWKDNKRKHKC